MKKLRLAFITLFSVSILTACASSQEGVLPTQTSTTTSVSKHTQTKSSSISENAIKSTSETISNKSSQNSTVISTVEESKPEVTTATSEESAEVVDYQDLTQSSEVASKDFVSGDNIVLESYEDLTQTSEVSAESVAEPVSTETPETIQDNTAHVDYQPQLNALWSGDYSSIAGTWKDNLGNQVTVDSAGVVYIYPSNAKWGGVQYPFLMLTAGGSSYGQLTYTASLTDKTAYDLVQAGEEGFGGAGMPGIMYAKDGAGERLYLTPNGTEVGFNVLTRVG